MSLVLPAAKSLMEGLLALRRRANETVRIEIPLRAPIDPLSWLIGQPAGNRLYWSDRDSDMAIAGFGIADEGHPEDIVPTISGARYFGGLAFSEEEPAIGPWRQFGPGLMRLPRLTVERHGGRGMIALNPAKNTIGLPHGVHAEVRHTTIAPQSQQHWQHAPDRVEWGQNIHAALDSFCKKGLQKVVMARLSALKLKEPCDPFSLLRHLSADQGPTFHFGLELAPGHAFFGCTPEKLFSRAGTEILTEALAGTRPRHPEPMRDRQLAESLLTSGKDANEHQHVVHAIDNALRPLCTTLQRDGSPSIRRLRSVQHLHTGFSGTLHDKENDISLLRALHPTPAVCGQPTDLAREFIKTHEPFHRGWYAGPIGWMGANQSCFAVAIRSALLWQQKLMITSGAGIVPRSLAEEEWDEIDAKSQPFFTLIANS